MIKNGTAFGTDVYSCKVKGVFMNYFKGQIVHPYQRRSDMP